MNTQRSHTGPKAGLGLGAGDELVVDEVDDDEDPPEDGAVYALYRIHKYGSAHLVRTINQFAKAGGLAVLTNLLEQESKIKLGKEYV